MRYHGPLGVAHGIHTDGTLHADAGTAAGFMTAAMVTKLAGIATGAQVCSFANVSAALAAANANVSLNGYGLTGLASILAPATAGLTLTGNLAAAAAGTDIAIASTATRTAGSIFSVSNAASALWTIGYAGAITHSPLAMSGTPSATVGSFLNMNSATFTDSTTSGSTTAPDWAARSFAVPTLVATNALVTTPIAATIRIMGPPAAGTNETITQGAALQIVTGAIVLNNATGANAEWGRIYWSGNALYIDTTKTGSGTARDIVVRCAANTYIVGGGVYLQTSSANRLGFNATGVGAVGPSATSGTPSATVGSFWNHVTATFTDNVTGDNGTAAGFAAVSIQGYTLAATHSTVTTTKVCTLYVGAPILGANEIFTASYAAHFAAAIRVDAAAAISGAGGAATLAATTGGATGPATAAQNEWVRIDTNSGVRYVPAWA